MKKSLAIIGLFGTSNDALELEVKECFALFVDVIESLKTYRGGFKLILARCRYRMILLTER